MAVVQLRRTAPSQQGEPQHLLAERRSLEDAAGLDDPDVIAAEIVEDLRAALAEFELIQEDLTPK
jgi:hypothetical protein